MEGRVFLVDDHPIVREGIGRLIDHEPDLTVCGEAEDALDALAGIEATRPDVAVIDLSLKDSSGLDLIQDLKRRFPGIKILVLSMYDEQFYAERVLRAGAMGYVMKHDPPRRVIAAIRRILDGKIYVSEHVSAKMIRDMVGPNAADAPASRIERLSDREMQVFQMIGEGRTHQEIAGRLNLSVKTVESHVERTKNKLQLASGRELLVKAIEWVLRHNGHGPVV